MHANNRRADRKVQPAGETVAGVPQTGNEISDLFKSGAVNKAELGFHRQKHEDIRRAQEVVLFQVDEVERELHKLTENSICDSKPDDETDTQQQ